MSNILVLAPHADDEVLGCGGTIYKHSQNNDDVYIAIMTNANIGAPEIYDEKTIKKVREEAINAHYTLGVKETFFEELPAPKLDQYPQYIIADKISKIIKEIQPNTLYIPHKGDLHLDHYAIYNATLVASRPLPGNNIKNIYAYETLSETEWGHPTNDCAFIPNMFSNISGKGLKKKLLAMECYASQIKNFPNARSLESIESLAKFRGSTIGVFAAEAFMVVRTII